MELDAAGVEGQALRLRDGGARQVRRALVTVGVGVGVGVVLVGRLDARLGTRASAGVD